MIQIPYRIIFSLILIVLCSGPALAVPQIPAEYYGSVFIDGTPAPVGTTISALLNGGEKGTLVTSVDGYYGGQGIFDDRLVVIISEDDYSSGNLEISFLVDGKPAQQKSTYEIGAVKQVDLTIGGGEPSATPVENTNIPVSSQDNRIQNSISDNYSEPSSSGQSGSTDITSSSISYGLDEDKIFKSDDGLAEVRFDKGTIIFTQTGEYLQQLSITPKNIAEIPSHTLPAGLQFSGYAYEINPQGTYFNPKGSLTIRPPPERSYDLIKKEPIIYEYIPQILSWQPVHTVSSVFTGEINGDVYEGAVFALFTTNTSPAELIQSANVTVPPGSSESLYPESQVPQIPQTPFPDNSIKITEGTDNTEGLTPPEFQQHSMAVVTTQTPVIIETQPVQLTEPEQKSSSLLFLPKTIISSIISRLSGTFGKILLVLLTIVCVNVIVYLIYTLWWIKKGKNE